MVLEHAYVQLGSASCLAQLSSATGKGEVTVKWGGKVTGPKQMNKWGKTILSKPQWNVYFILSFCFVVNSPVDKINPSTMWPFWKAQSCVVGIAVNASLWRQLWIKQTPTYPHQRTVSPLTAAESFYILLHSSIVTSHNGLKTFDKKCDHEVFFALKMREWFWFCTSV